MTNRPVTVVERPPQSALREPARSAGEWRWYVCGLLFLATVLNYLDRQTMALCAPLLTAEFGLSADHLVSSSPMEEL